MSMSLRDWAKTYGMEVDWKKVSSVDENKNPFNTGQVTVRNPNNQNLSYSFTQGQGGGYGVGRFDPSGTHYVTDHDKLYNMMTAKMPQTDTVSDKAPYAYDMKYLTDENVQKRFDAIDKPFSYDPQSDNFLQQAQGQAKDAVMRYYAQHGLAVGSKMQQRMQNEAQNLVPQYENIAYGRHMDERQNQYNMLAQKAQLEGINYQQFKDLQNYEVEQYGTTLTPEMRKNIQIYQSMDPMLRRDLDNAYGKDFHAEINRRRAIEQETGQKDELIPVLEALRANKVLRDPKLMKQYGWQYGFSSSAIAERAANYETQMAQKRSMELDVQLKEIEAKYAEQYKKAELNLVMKQLEAADYDNAMLKIKSANFPRMMELELLQMAANLQATYASADASRASAEATRKSMSDSGSSGSEDFSWGDGKTSPMSPEQQNQAYAQILPEWNKLDPYTRREQLTGPDKDKYISTFGLKNYNTMLEKANKDKLDWDKIQLW